MHATCVAILDMGILIQGPPGSGKSDMALRLMDQPGCGHGGKALPAQLVADDQVMISLKGNSLHARAPLSLRGKLEIRGLGIVPVDCLSDVRLTLAVRLVALDMIERMPDVDKCHIEILGSKLPLVLIDPGSCSAPARIRAAALEFSGRDQATC